MTAEYISEYDANVAKVYSMTNFNLNRVLTSNTAILQDPEIHEKQHI